MRLKGEGEMASLYELTGQMAYLKELLEDSEVEEPVVLETMESIEYEIEEKADGYAEIIRMLSSEVDAIDGEREKAIRNRIYIIFILFINCILTFSRQCLENSLPYYHGRIIQFCCK